MQNAMESAAKRFGVSSEVLDLIGRHFISEVTTDFPSLLLPPIMQTLKHDQVLHGLDWIKQNATSIREEFLLLSRLYGPTWVLT